MAQRLGIKDNLISDNSVHPVAREAIYRSVHRLVSKVIIRNDHDEILMAKVNEVTSPVFGHFLVDTWITMNTQQQGVFGKH